MQNYVDVLFESLEKKIQILNEIKIKNKEQTSILKKSPFVADDFDKNVEEKGLLVEELSKLDDGFDAVYGRVRDALVVDKEKYKEQIRKMQAMIADITDRSVSIQAEEKRNKALVESVFATERLNAKKSKKTSKVSLDYYKNMSRTNYIDPQFMDMHK